MGLSLVAANGGYSLDVMQGLLFAVASLVADHRPWGLGLQQLQLMGSTARLVVVLCGLSCPVLSHSVVSDSLRPHGL